MILVTGATGMVGAHLIWHLLQQQDRVTAVKRESSQLENIQYIFGFYTTDPEQYLKRIDWVILDLGDFNAVKQTLANIDTVYHCAAHVSLTINDKQAFESNIKSTKNLVDACLINGVRKFCFVSSIAACGKSDNNQWVDETIQWTDTQHTSEYARSKYLSELEVCNGMKQGLQAVIVNPGVIIGVSQSKSGSSQLFHAIKNGLKVYTNGGSGYVDVRDVVKIMIALTQGTSTMERYIIVAENCSTKDALSMIADGFQLTRPYICAGKYTMMAVAYVLQVASKLFNFVPAMDIRMARTSSNRTYYDASKIKNLLHYEFIPLRTAIDDVCSYMTKTK